MAIFRNAFCIAALLLPVVGVAASELPSGTPISEPYRQKFEQCDASDKFGTVQFPIKNAAGKTRWFPCRKDPSRLTRLERVAAAGDRPEAIIFVAKLAHDQDGSRLACETPGLTDQCGTSLMLKPTEAHPCPKVLAKTGPRCLPVDADTIPYVAIPAAAPAGIDAKAFRTLTGVRLGDLGMVLFGGKAVPVIVADGGPAYKIGEGSTALLKALSNDGKARQISGGVTFILFPRSASTGVTADTLADDVSTRAQALFKKLSGGS